MTSSKLTLTEFKDWFQIELNKAVDTYLNQAQISFNSPLYSALKYALSANGKMLRPYLVFEFGQLFGLSKRRLTNVAIAIEYIHTYSLVHDDLPCMDDAALRRSRPTTHRRYNDAIAVLVGDALQSMAFEVLSSYETHIDAEVRVRLIQLLAKCAGPKGMVLGQDMDMYSEIADLSAEQIQEMNRLKTSELFKFSCLAPAIMARQDKDVLAQIEKFANNLGILFQITDDLIDLKFSEEKAGKTISSDAAKSNYVQQYGESEARKLVQSYEKDCLDILESLDDVNGSLKGFVFDLARRA